MTDTTDTETAPPVTIPADVAAFFVETFEGLYGEEHLLNAMQCFEVDAIANLLHALGYATDAQAWRDAHRKDCEVPDNHTY